MEANQREAKKLRHVCFNEHQLCYPSCSILKLLDLMLTHPVWSNRLMTFKFGDSLRPRPALELRQRKKIARELYELMNQAIAE